MGLDLFTEAILARPIPNSYWLGSGPFAEDVDANVGEIEGYSGGEGGVYWEGEAGEVNQGGDGSGDKGGVAGILFEALD